VTAAAVGAAALLTALATGLGAAPLALRRAVPGRGLALANAAAAGFMLAAGAGLLREGWAHDPGRALVGGAAGALFVLAARRAFRGRTDAHLGADALKAATIVGVMTIHSVAEGVGVGVAYGGGEALGMFITIAIAVHNVPEGLAISLVLVPRGVRPLKAAGWSVFSSLPQPLLAVPAFLFVESFLPLLPLGLGFAAGAMAWMVAAELLPDARAGASGRAVAAALLAAYGAMLAFQGLVLGL
jgi:zinc transporter ZupT